MLNLIGGLLQLPGMLLKKTLGLGEEEQTPEPKPAQDKIQYSDEMREELGNRNDLNSLAAPLAGSWGLHVDRYDYNPQAARVADQYIANLQKF